MKEWISLSDGDDSLGMAREARDFDGGKCRRGRDALVFHDDRKPSCYRRRAGLYGERR